MRPLRTLSHIPTPTLREASNKHQITEERERSSPRATGPLPSARQFVYPNALLTVRLLQQVSSGRKKCIAIGGRTRVAIPVLGC